MKSHNAIITKKRDTGAMVAHCDKFDDCSEHRSKLAVVFSIIYRAFPDPTVFDDISLFHEW